MRGFLYGIVVGAVLASAVGAAAAVIAGSDGYATEWTVTKAGQEICYAPFIYTGSKEIECD